MHARQYKAASCPLPRLSVACKPCGTPIWTGPPADYCRCLRGHRAAALSRVQLAETACLNHAGRVGSMHEARRVVCGAVFGPSYTVKRPRPLARMNCQPALLHLITGIVAACVCGRPALGSSELLIGTARVIDGYTLKVLPLNISKYPQVLPAISCQDDLTWARCWRHQVAGERIRLFAVAAPEEAWSL